MLVKFEYDPDKREINLRKHGLDFNDVHRLFAGPFFEFEDDRYDYGEERWVAIGMIYDVVSICVWTPRNNGSVRRIISLRKADNDESKDYFESF